MPEPTPDAASKVEAAVAAVLEAYASLSGWSIVTDQPADVALEGETLKALVVRSIGPTFDHAFEPGAQTLNVLTVDIEAVVREAGTVLPRRQREGLAHAMAALAADRSLGGRVQDLQEIDAAQGDGNQRDVSAMSLQWRAEYLTGRADPFTILGLAGATF